MTALEAYSHIVRSRRDRAWDAALAIVGGTWIAAMGFAAGLYIGFVIGG